MRRCKQQTAAINDLKCKIFSSMASIKISDLFLCCFMEKKKRLFQASKERNKKRFPWPSNRLSRSTSDFFLPPTEVRLYLFCLLRKGNVRIFRIVTHVLSNKYFSVVCGGWTGRKKAWNENRLVPLEGQKPQKNLSCLSSDENLLLHDLFSASDTTKTYLVAVKLIEPCFVLISRKGRERWRDQTWLALTPRWIDKVNQLNQFEYLMVM